jgi:hypothetical protein
LAESQLIVFKVVVLLKDWLLQTAEAEVGSTPVVVYLTTVPPVPAEQVTAWLVWKYPEAVQVGAPVGAVTSIIKGPMAVEYPIFPTASVFLKQIYLPLLASVL